MVPERICAAQSKIEGVGEGANGSIARSAQDPSPVQLGNVRVLLNQGHVVEDKAVEESIGAKGDDDGGQQETEKGDPLPRRVSTVGCCRQLVPPFQSSRSQSIEESMEPVFNLSPGKLLSGSTDVRLE